MEPIDEILAPAEGEPDIRHCTATEVVDYRKKKQEEKRRFDDKLSVEDKLAEIHPKELSNEFDSSKVQMWKELVTKYLRESDYVPNNNQLAISISAALRFKTSKR